MKIRSETIREFVKTVSQDVEKRQSEWAEDPFARGMQKAATDLSKLLDSIETRTLTVDEFAEKHDVAPQTVRRWIRKGQLPAENTPHGWRIAPEAEPIVEVGAAE